MCFPNNSTTASVLPENEAAAAIWNAGGREYDRISRQIADAIEHCVDRLAPQPMERILDLATGTGWAARRIADRGASVTGIDLSSEAIETARSLDLSGKTDFHVGDAEALSFPDQDFDAIISTFGVMFCGNPSQAASEMARVCKPGGRMALAIWDNHGGVFDMFELISSYKPKSSPAASSPFAWADVDRLEQLFGNNFDLKVERATSFYRESTADEAWEAFVTGYGPVKMLASKLSDDRSDRLREDFIDFHRRFETPAGILVPRPYLIVTGARVAS